MGEIHVKDSTDTLRDIQKIFVKDSTGTIRGPIRKAFVLDGSNVRDVFTKTDTLSVSGTSSTLNTAQAEQVTITVNSIDNQVTSETYTRTIGTQTVGGSVANLTGSAVLAQGQGSFSVAFSQRAQFTSNMTCGSNGNVTANGNIVFTSGGSGQGDNAANMGFSGGVRVCHVDAVVNSAGTISNPAHVYANFTGSGSSTTTSASLTTTISSGTSLGIPNGVTSFKMMSYVQVNKNPTGDNFSTASSFLNNPSGAFTSTGPTNTVALTSTNSSANGNCTFSVSGPFTLNSTTFSATDNTSTAASDINTAIQSVLPAGASSSASSNVVTINFAAGAVTDLVFTEVNGSQTGSATPANTNGATSTLTPGGSVNAPNGVTEVIVNQGTNESGALSVVPITTGGTTTNITITTNSNTDSAGTQIATALNSISGVDATFDSGTDKVTVITAGDVSVGTITNANSLAVAVD